MDSNRFNRSALDELLKQAKKYADLGWSVDLIPHKFKQIRKHKKKRINKKWIKKYGLKEVL